MPGKLAAFRELPDAMTRVTIMATLALFVSVVAIIVAIGGRHGS